MSAAEVPTSSPELKQIALHYWGGRGLMEVPRTCLAIAGRFPGDAYNGYLDHRHTTPPKGDLLAANLGRLPLCVTADGHSTIGQSAAINFYIADETGMMGSNSVEAAKIMGIVESLKELREAWHKLVPHGSQGTPESLTLFFEGTEASDLTGPAVSGTASKRHLQWYLGRLEHLVGDKGYAVGSKLSLADVYMFNMFADFLPLETHPDMPQMQREPFGDLARVQKVLKAFPKIEACVASVANHPNVIKWHAMRGVQGF